jgi:hypothetical protein
MLHHHNRIDDKSYATPIRLFRLKSSCHTPSQRGYILAAPEATAAIHTDVWELGFFIKKHSQCRHAAPKTQNTCSLSSLFFFFFLCMCDGVWKKIRSRKEGNHILLMMSFSTTQQDINYWLKSSSKELSIYFLLVVSLQNTERLEMPTKRRITAVRFYSSLHWRLNRNHTDTHTQK